MTLFEAHPVEKAYYIQEFANQIGSRIQPKTIRAGLAVIREHLESGRVADYLTTPLAELGWVIPGSHRQTELVIKAFELEGRHIFREARRILGSAR